ncbi:MAG: DUF1893 domain-containing protein [Candidatus Bathyarchaeia archaeon]
MNFNDGFRNSQAKVKQRKFDARIVKNSEVIFESKNRGISGFLEALEKFGNNIKKSSAADRVVGKAHSISMNLRRD